MMEKGELLSVVESGFNDKPENQQHLMGRVATLCYRRFKNMQSAKCPFQYGQLLPQWRQIESRCYGICQCLGEKWNRGEKNLRDYMNDENQVSFHGR